MGTLRHECFENSSITFDADYEFLLKDPKFLEALETVKTLKPLSVPLWLEVNGKLQFFHVRRTQHNHFTFLHQATNGGASFPKPVINIRDHEIHRFYLVTTYKPVQPLLDFLATPSIPNKRKLNVLKQVIAELTKLSKTKLRHGNIIHENIFVNENDGVMLYDPELDEEVIGHIQSDYAQFRETLFHLERDLDHEPEELWNTVKNDPFFKKLK
ncbi:MAG: hypothetical protein V1644_00205 [Candidatus Micrarchaeota archaeon]